MMLAEDLTQIVKGSTPESRVYVSSTGSTKRDWLIGFARRWRGLKALCEWLNSAVGSRTPHIV